MLSAERREDATSLQLGEGGLLYVDYGGGDVYGIRGRKKVVTKEGVVACEELTSILGQEGKLEECVVKAGKRDTDTGFNMQTLGDELKKKWGGKVIKGKWDDAARMDQSRSNAYVLAAMREVCARICPEDATAMYEDVLRGMEPAPKVVEDKLLRTVSSMANILPETARSAPFC
jgi:hypothetical protein